jgi:hypothetical protein
MPRTTIGTRTCVLNNATISAIFSIIANTIKIYFICVSSSSCCCCITA